MKNIPKLLCIVVVATFICCQASGQDYGDTVVLKGGHKVFVKEKVAHMPEPTFDILGFLSRTIIYPDSARENNIEGKVIVGFTIDEQGHVIDVLILSSPHELLSREVVRVISKMPKWKPGSNDGQPVKVAMAMPIGFQLEDRGPRRVKRRSRKE